MSDSRRGRLALGVLFAALALVGCASPQVVVLRSEPHTPLAIPLQLNAWRGPQPSPQTTQFLREHDLLAKARLSTRWAVGDVAKIHRRHPSAASCYALSELSFIAGRSTELSSRQQAQVLYWNSMVHAYEYLFDPKYEMARAPYDPQFRFTCDLYNGALENWLRIADKRGNLQIGRHITVATRHESLEVPVTSAGAAWKAEDLERLRFVSDYKVTGLENQHITHGLGVPLIAVRRRGTAPPEIERYYARGLSFPMTAFLRPRSPAEPSGNSDYVLELHDPVEKPNVAVVGQQVPLESDITTPLAYFLNDANFDQFETDGLLHPAGLRKVTGLYMVRPFQHGKIPVVMIHGLWSSPMTWMQAINDLQSYPEIRDHFQFWFYLYPTGEPFPVTAAALRRDLAQLRQTFVAGRAAPELDQMVLVGHSMGGLIARSLAIDGPDAMQSVTRVVTIATPFRGSDDSNDVTRWLARQVIRLPKNTMNATRNFLISGSPASKNPQDFDDLTSIDTLSPKSPILQALLERRPLPAVTFHNVIGVTGSKPRESGSDGIVTYASAHLDDVASQLVVPAAHMHVHQHPRTILELRRILGVHLQALGIPAAAPIQLLHGRDEAAVEEHPETEGDPQRRTAEPVFDSL